MAPLRGFRGKTGPQLEVAGVKQGAALAFQERLRRAQNMAGGEQRDVEIPKTGPLLKIQEVFVALRSEPRSHEPGRPRRRDHFPVVGDVIAVGVRDEGERLSLPGIKPKAVRGNFKPSFIADLDHAAAIDQCEVWLKAAPRGKMADVPANRPRPSCSCSEPGGR